MKTTKLFLIMFAAAVALAGCKKYDDTNVVNRIDKLEERVTTLEEAVAALDAQIKAGAMISSVTEIVEDGESLGWRIAFTGGTKPSIDILHGTDAAAAPDPEDGKTPLLDVRRNDDGSTTLWVDYGDGNGWQNTGTDLTGPTGSGGSSGGQGPQGVPGDNGLTPRIVDGYWWIGETNTGVKAQGEQGGQGNPGDNGLTPRIVDGYWWIGETNTGIKAQGEQGGQGIQGPAPKLKVQKNANNTVTVWYSTAAPDYPAESYVDTGYDLSVTGPVTTITDNGDHYTVTLSNEEGTEYLFAKASSAVRLELMLTDDVSITEGETVEVTFVVNPSTAWVPTTNDGGVARWELNDLPEVPTRAGYVKPDGALTVTDVRPMYDDESKQGMYIATITCAPDGYGPVETEGRHNVALVLNTASDEAPVLVSSEAFTVWVAEAPEPWIGVDTQTGELVEGTAGTATYEIQTENVADDAPVTVAWCDAQGTAAEAPTGIVAPTGAVVTDNAIALTFEVESTAVAGDYYFTVSAGGATSDMMTLTVAEGDTPYFTNQPQSVVPTAGTAAPVDYAISAFNMEADTPVTVAWCDAQGAATEAPAGITAPTDATTGTEDGDFMLTLDVAAEAAAGDYWFTVSAGGATSAPIKLTVAAAPIGPGIGGGIEDWGDGNNGGGTGTAE